MIGAAEYAAREGISVKEARQRAALMPGAVKEKDINGRLVWRIPGGNPEPQAEETSMPDATPPFRYDGGADAADDGGTPPAENDAYASMVADVGAGSDSADTDSVASPQDVAGVSGIIYGILSLALNLPGQNALQRQEAVAGLVSDNAGALIVETVGISTKGMRLVIVALGLGVLFLPAVLRRKGVTGDNSGRLGNREISPIARNSAEDDIPAAIP